MEAGGAFQGHPNLPPPPLMVDQLFSTAALLVKLPTSLSLNQGVKHFLPARWYWVYSIHCYAGKKKATKIIVQSSLALRFFSSSLHWKSMLELGLFLLGYINLRPGFCLRTPKKAYLFLWMLPFQDHMQHFHSQTSAKTPEFGWICGILAAKTWVGLWAYISYISEKVQLFSSSF